MDKQALYEQKGSFFLQRSSVVRGGILFCVLSGLAAFVAGMATGEAARTWGSFLFNLLFFFTIALGGVAFGNMQDVIGAHWGRPIKRLHESFGSFVAVAAGAIVFFLACMSLGVLGADQVYLWMADPAMLAHFHGKDVWLQPWFMISRDLVAIAMIYWLVRRHLRLTTAGDRALLAGDQRQAEVLAEESRRALKHWSAPTLVLYALLYTLLVFDLTMSLAPTWFSTLWGGWSFSVMMQTLFATILLFMFWLRPTPLARYYKRQQYHDVGKLMFGFTVFYAYLTYSHILTYWYTNMPEETSYFLVRMESAWLPWVWVAGIGTFLLPFFVLIPKASKWTPWVTIPISCVVLVSQWLVALLVVMPEVVKELSFPWIELGMMLGFLGFFMGSFFAFAEKVPLLNLTDPILPEAYDSH